jgi:hypothetical protein
MTTITGMDSVPVHIASSDIQLTPAAPGCRRRRALKTRTYTLTAASPVDMVLPQADTRTEAWITSAVGASPPVIFISPTQAGAQAQAGGAAQINGTDTTPFPVNTTDQVWISAAAGFPVTVSVVAIYEEDE